MCELLRYFATEGENAPPNINKIAAKGAVPAGPEYSHFSELCFAFNIPSTSDKMYILAEKAGKEEYNLAKEAGDVSEDLIPYVSVIVDGP
ncbi:hypothetical protein ILUMI_13989 [Ignelater luminosus]|uniref:Uncharacterized protein n=1 Tax=Ignelater luminosus TaxID=2038154 RepID=A0A8K0GAE4_IGNLU|nr:hypothetical protein ILUMI_13989 [Ignelater luminosus]